MGGELVNWRRADVNSCYNTTDVDLAKAILDSYEVQYIYLGEYERAYYNQGGLDKFGRMVEQQLLRVVYDARGATIYEVIS